MSVGLDVHARSVTAAAIDGATRELFKANLTPSHEQIRGWLGELPGPVAVVYEAGPTGFGLYRSLSRLGPVQISNDGEDDPMNIDQAVERAAALQLAINQARRMDDSPAGLLSAKEVERVYGVPVATLYAWERCGSLHPGADRVAGGLWGADVDAVIPKA